MQKLRSVIFLTLLLSAANVGAEHNCPNGYYPIGGGNAGWQGCAPMQGGGTGHPGPVGPSWADRYGAIAIDPTTGKFAGVDGMSSRRRAEKAALAGCKRDGGSKCKVLDRYSNQCGSLAWGDSAAHSFHAPTAQMADDGAVRLCSARTTNCDIFFSGCSYPERVR